MAWWLWALGALGLLGAELLAPGGFFFLFFGIGALVTALLAGTGVVDDASAQWLAFTVLSVAALALFRGRLRARAERGAPGVGGLVGEVGVLLDDLPPGSVGRMELRGTTWSARHRGTEALAHGQRCRVERVDGLLLWVCAEAPAGGRAA